VVLSRRLPADDDAPRTARTLMAQLHLAMGPLDGHRATDLDVAVSELVTNAVLHSGASEIELCLSLNESTVRIEVGDPGRSRFDWPPEGSTPADDNGGGWGLRLVATFTDRHGIDRRPNTVAWCELDLI
jgi:anti-sigma regulatory factor (Ser/Thr protein kinase)